MFCYNYWKKDDQNASHRLVEICFNMPTIICVRKIKSYLTNGILPNTLESPVLIEIMFIVHSDTFLIGVRQNLANWRILE